MTELTPWARPPWIEDPAGNQLPYERVLQLAGAVTVSDDPSNGRTVADIDGGGGGPTILNPVTFEAMPSRPVLAIIGPGNQSEPPDLSFSAQDVPPGEVESGPLANGATILTVEYAPAVTVTNNYAIEVVEAETAGTIGGNQRYQATLTKALGGGNIVQIEADSITGSAAPGDVYVQVLSGGIAEAQYALCPNPGTGLERNNPATPLFIVAGEVQFIVIDSTGADITVSGLAAKSIYPNVTVTVD